MAPTTRVTLHHLSLEVRDLGRTEWFYDRFLGRLGFRRFAQDVDYLAYTDGTVTFWLMRPRNPRIHRNPPDPMDEVVPEHLAFRVESREEVAAVEADLIREGVYPLFRTEEHPQFRAGYVSASWVDPNDIVLEVYTVPVPSAGRTKRPARRPAARKRPAKRPAPVARRKAKK